MLCPVVLAWSVVAEVLSFLARDLKCSVFLSLAKNDNTSAIADHVKATGHNIKWDHFEILVKGKTDYHCKIKETLFIQGCNALGIPMPLNICKNIRKTSKKFSKVFGELRVIF